MADREHDVSESVSPEVIAALVSLARTRSGTITILDFQVQQILASSGATLTEAMKARAVQHAILLAQR